MRKVFLCWFVTLFPLQHSCFLLKKKMICSAICITVAPNGGFVPCFGALWMLVLWASAADGHRQRWLQNTNAGTGSHKAPLLKNALAIQCLCTMLSNRRAEKPCSGIFFFQCRARSQQGRWLFASHYCAQASFRAAVIYTDKYQACHLLQALIAFV